MMAAWMIYSTVVALLLYGAGRAFDRVARALRWPTRTGWLVVMTLAASMSAAALISALRPVRPTAPSDASAIGSLVDARRGNVRELDDLQSPARTGHAAFESRLLTALDLSTWLDVDRIDGWNRVLGGAAASAAGLGLAWLLFGCLRLARRAERFDAAQLDGVDLLVSDDLGPALFGILVPRVVVPRWVWALQPDERQMILLHERSHVAARDPLVALGTRLLTVLAPWNAGFWLLAASLRAAIEVDCDARVLGKDHDPRRYCALLVDVYERMRPDLAISPALVDRPSRLERRIRRITGPRPSRFSALTCAAALAAVGLAVAACDSSAPTSRRNQVTASVALVTGGGRCVNRPLLVNHQIDMFGEMARRTHPEIVNDTSATIGRVIVLVVDEDCNLLRDTTLAARPGEQNANAIFDAAFPDLVGKQVGVGVMGGGLVHPGSDNSRGNFTIAYGVVPSRSWTSRRASDACGFGARSQDMCSVVGSVVMRRVDSVRLIISVRGSSVHEPNAPPTDEMFLVTSVAPLPAALTQSIKFARVFYQNNAVFVENRATTELPVVFGGLASFEIAHLPRPVIRFDRIVGVAHYRGTVIPLEQVRNLKPASRCDGPVGSCYVARGVSIEFPA
ncbi:MAG: M56 family metallopeptidase [Gemmatimonadales bacterium]